MGFLKIYKDAINEKHKKIIELQKILVIKNKEIDRLKTIAMELLKEKIDGTRTNIQESNQ